MRSLKTKNALDGYKRCFHSIRPPFFSQPLHTISQTRRFPLIVLEYSINWDWSMNNEISSRQSETDFVHQSISMYFFFMLIENSKKLSLQEKINFQSYFKKAYQQFPKLLVWCFKIIFFNKKIFWLHI